MPTSAHGSELSCPTLSDVVLPPALGVWSATDALRGSFTGVIVMTKRDALRLEPGQLLLCGNNNWVCRCTLKWWARVVKVTERGGILVKSVVDGIEKWTPYNHVIRCG